jgi:hypothetical protein
LAEDFEQKLKTCSFAADNLFIWAKNVCEQFRNSRLL